MMRPHVEARALLGARGLFVPTDFRDYFRRPEMAHDTKFALVRDPGNGSHKPSVFATLHGLADSIHRQAKGAPLQLVDEYLTFRGEATPRRGVSVWRLDALTNDRDGFIGWAWLDGADRLVLSAAMPRRQGGVAAIRAA